MLKCSVQITLVDWNVRVKNKNIQKIIDSFVSCNYDIITLQEVPHWCLTQLMEIPGYHFAVCKDFDSTQDVRGVLYLVVLSKHKITNYDTLVLRDEPISNLFSKILFDRLRKIVPIHQALKTEIQIGNNLIHIHNVHLPGYVSPLTRLALLKKLLEKITQYTKSILVGDFNIFSLPLVPLFSGWLRDYTLAEYIINERSEAEKLYAQHKLTSNVFGRSTYAFFPFATMQMDNVLTPENITVHSVSTLKPGGSDHLPVKVILDI